ncbi:MAG: HD domain-containing protein [Rikenellaceae bacterium]
MNRIDRLSRCVVEYYAAYSVDIHDDIQHTQEVVCYTEMIASGEGFEAVDREMQIAAAWLHDIGCPRSKELYGNSLPQNQQSVGREVTKELLHSKGDLFGESEIEWLSEVVGRHHQAGDVESYNFRPLFEADLIVNLLSSYHPRENAPMLYEKLMRTQTGRDIFRVVIK